MHGKKKRNGLSERICGRHASEREVEREVKGRSLAFLFWRITEPTLHLISVDIDITGGDPESKPVITNGDAPGEHTSVTLPVKFVSKSGTQTPKDDDPWELDCELCHRRGMNLVGYGSLHCKCLLVDLCLIGWRAGAYVLRKM